MQAVRLLQRGYIASPLPHQHLAAPAWMAPRRTQLRCLASASQDKSWGELMSSAADLGKAVAGKVGETLKNVATSIVPSSSGSKDQDLSRESSSSRARQAQVVQEETLDSQLRAVTRDAFGGGIAGRMLGGLLSRTLGGALQGLEQTRQATQALQQEAAYAIASNEEVRRALGGTAEVESPFAQENSTVSINGRVQTQVRLRMPVVGPRGMAEAVVEQNGDDTHIHVELPNGRRVLISTGSGGGGGGQVIDVDWKEVQ